MPNALRAGLVGRAGHWRWSSRHARLNPNPRPGAPAPAASDWPVPRPADWLDLVNEPLPAADLAEVRDCAARGRPFGEASWVRRTPEALGLGFTLRPRGRPPTPPLRSAPNGGDGAA